MLRTAGENGEEILKFLKRDENPLRRRMLDALSVKDYKDLKADVLEDHLDCSRCDLPEDIFEQYVLSPRIWKEELKPWRSEIRARFTEEEKEADPDKEDTGLFFFRGDPGARTAVLNAGGGFVYVAAMHDSFPQALELSQNGYNAFALIYRPGAQTACEDLARAIAFLHENAEELRINMTNYSLWGGSAGARMAAWLGSYGTAAFGEDAYSRPAAVIMQYTGLSEVTGYEPPTYACVGTSDGIAYYRTVENYISQIQQDGTDAEVEVFNGLRHGFGLGQGTVAEGWIDRAISFWERNMGSYGR